MFKQFHIRLSQTMYEHLNYFIFFNPHLSTQYNLDRRETNLFVPIRTNTLTKKRKILNRAI
jgi:hypothetical protein